MITMELDSAAVQWVRKETLPSATLKKKKKGHITFVPTVICEILFVSCYYERSYSVGLPNLL